MILAEIIIILSIIFLMTWVFIGLVIYFIPVIVAYIRKHKNIATITILNVVLGWTFLGWLASLLWALNSDIEEDDQEINE